MPHPAVHAFVATLLASSLLPASAHAQAAGAGVPPAPIRDNSFLLEEAYNQEYRVVQHISALVHDQRTGLWSYSFTQEWPVPGMRHQLSYTIPIANEGGPGHRGVGDFALNYRYQLVGMEENARVAVAPRVSLVLPTGSVTRGLGRGASGVQLNIPVSVELTRWLVSHTNAGASLTPRARTALGDRATLREYNVGQSFIWLTRPTFNVMLETTLLGTADVVGPDRTERHVNLFIAPAIRKAFNFRSGLQIVPGLAVPFEFGDQEHDPVLLVYLSFEHPF